MVTGQDKENALAAWLDDQRMAHALGQLDASQVADLQSTPGALGTPPGAHCVNVLRRLVKEFTGILDVFGGKAPAWEDMAAAARDHILSDSVIRGRTTWLQDGNGYFTSFHTYLMSRR